MVDLRDNWVASDAGLPTILNTHADGINNLTASVALVNAELDAVPGTYALRPDHIDVLPAALAVGSGTPAMGYTSALGAGMMFDGVADEVMYVGIPIPSTWAAVTLQLSWTTASVGSVRWKTYLSSMVPGDLWSTGPSLISDCPITAASKQVRSTLNTAVAVTPGSMVLVRIDRLASSSLDTITTDACLQLVQLIKAG